MVQHLQRLGDQIVLVIEPALAAQAGLGEGSEVEVAVAGNTIVVAPLPAGQHQRSAVVRGELKKDEVLRRLAE